MRSMGQEPVLFQSRTNVVAFPSQCIGKSRSRGPTLVVFVTVLRFAQIVL